VCVCLYVCMYVCTQSTLEALGVYSVWSFWKILVLYSPMCVYVCMNVCMSNLLQLTRNTIGIFSKKETVVNLYIQNAYIHHVNTSKYIYIYWHFRNYVCLYVSIIYSYDVPKYAVILGGNLTFRQNCVALQTYVCMVFSCMWVYVRMYICMYVSMYACMNGMIRGACLYVCLFVFMFVCMYVCMVW